MNLFKTGILLAALTALLVGVGGALGGESGLIIALLLAGGMNFGAYWFSDRIVLRMHGAEPLIEAEAPELYALVRRLARAAYLPMPQLYRILDPAPNAFATGRDPAHGVVAVTQGLLDRLDREELAGVVAHELAHIQNRDTLIMSVAATLAGAVSMLANLAQWSVLFGGGRSSDNDESAPSPLAGLLGILVAPIAAALIQMAISRSREYLADAAAARITGNPRALAGALKAIATWSQQVPATAAAPATAHLFIVNPFMGGGPVQLFSTHPPVADRIARLVAMERSGASIRRAR